MPEEIKASEELIDVGETTGAEIDLDDKGEAVKQEEVKEEIEVEQVPEDKTYENEKQVKLDQKKPEEKDELKEYSEGVQKRIAKLTRKMREAERQREEAVNYAQSVTQQKNQAEQRLSKLDKTYVSEFESRVNTSMAAAKLALKNAIESQNVEAQPEGDFSRSLLEDLALTSSTSGVDGNNKGNESLRTRILSLFLFSQSVLLSISPWL